MAEETLKHKAVKGVFWKFGEFGIRQFIQFFVSVILARLIMPDQFGMIAMIGIFNAVANVFIDSGFTQALTRKNDRTQADCSTVYWFNVAVSLICYVIIFLLAPLAADFYGMPEISPILRVTAIGIVVCSFTGVHGTLLSAELDFKALTKFSILGSLISAIVGVSMAYLGFQVWALVAQGLTACLVGSLFVWYKVKWRPTFEFSKESFKEFFGFGSKLLGSRLLDTVYNNIYGIVIGKVYKAADLAFYNRGSALLGLVSNTPTGILQSVSFPTLCKLQEDENALRNGYRRMLRLSAFIIFPLCLGMGAVAYPLINVVYTKTWIFSASLLSILCFQLMWFPIHAINLNYLVVKGRSDLFFRLEVIKKIQGIIMLCITVPLGLEAMCWGGVVTSLLCLIYNTYYNGKLLGMGILSQLRDFSHVLALCAVMYVATRLCAQYMGDGLISLISSISVGTSIYIGGALIFRFPEVKEILNLRK